LRHLIGLACVVAMRRCAAELDLEDRVHAWVYGQHWALEECLPPGPGLIEANSGQAAASSCVSIVLCSSALSSQRRIQIGPMALLTASSIQSFSARVLCRNERLQTLAERHTLHNAAPQHGFDIGQPRRLLCEGDGQTRDDAIVLNLGLAVRDFATIDGGLIAALFSRAAQVSAAVRSRARRATASCQLGSLVLLEVLLISFAPT
jgi:hypothetical protein